MFPARGRGPVALRRGAPAADAAPAPLGGRGRGQLRAAGEGCARRRLLRSGEPLLVQSLARRDRGDGMADTARLRRSRAAGLSRRWLLSRASDSPARGARFRHVHGHRGRPAGCDPSMADPFLHAGVHGVAVHVPARHAALGQHQRVVSDLEHRRHGCLGRSGRDDPFRGLRCGCACRSLAGRPPREGGGACRPLASGALRGAGRGVRLRSRLSRASLLRIMGLRRHERHRQPVRGARRDGPREGARLDGGAAQRRERALTSHRRGDDRRVRADASEALGTPCLGQPRRAEGLGHSRLSAGPADRRKTGPGSGRLAAAPGRLGDRNLRHRFGGNGAGLSAARTPSAPPHCSWPQESSTWRGWRLSSSTTG